MNIRMYTAAREATTKARNVASAIQQVTRQVNDDNKDIMDKVDKNTQVRSKRKAELELAAALGAKKLAEKQAKISSKQAGLAMAQIIGSVVASQVGKGINKEAENSERTDKNREYKGKDPNKDNTGNKILEVLKEAVGFNAVRKLFGGNKQERDAGKLEKEDKKEAKQIGKEAEQIEKGETPGSPGELSAKNRGLFNKIKEVVKGEIDKGSKDDKATLGDNIKKALGIGGEKEDSDLDPELKKKVGDAIDKVVAEDDSDLSNDKGKFALTQKIKEAVKTVLLDNQKTETPAKDEITGSEGNKEKNTETLSKLDDPNPNAKKIEQNPGQPDAEKIEQNPGQPDAEKIEQNPGQPDAEKIEQNPGQPDAEKIEQNPGQPDAEKIEQNPGQPDAEKIEQNPGQPDAEKTEQKPEIASGTLTDTVPGDNNPNATVVPNKGPTELDDAAEDLDQGPLIDPTRGPGRESIRGYSKLMVALGIKKGEPGDKPIGISEGTGIGDLLLTIAALIKQLNELTKSKPSESRFGAFAGKFGKTGEFSKALYLLTEGTDEDLNVVGRALRDFVGKPAAAALSAPIKALSGAAENLQDKIDGDLEGSENDVSQELATTGNVSLGSQETVRAGLESRVAQSGLTGDAAAGKVNEGFNAFQASVLQSKLNLGNVTITGGAEGSDKVSISVGGDDKGVGGKTAEIDKGVLAKALAGDKASLDAIKVELNKGPTVNVDGEKEIEPEDINTGTEENGSENIEGKQGNNNAEGLSKVNPVSPEVSPENQKS